MHVKRIREDDRDRLVKISEAAQILGVSIGTLRKWHRAGKIDAVITAGGHRRFRVSDLLRLAPPPQQVIALYIVSAQDASRLEQMAKTAGMEVAFTIQEDVTSLQLPLPMRPGFQALVKLYANREITGFLVFSIKDLGWAIEPWLEVLRALGLRCFYTEADSVVEFVGSL